MATLSDQPDIFENTTLAQRHQGIDPTHQSNPKGAENNDDDLMAQLDGHLDSLVLAATNSNAVLSACGCNDGPVHKHQGSP